MWLQFKRSFKAGVSNFTHNIWLAMATIGVVTVALFIINIQICNIVANKLLLEDITDRVNISVYLNQDVDDVEGHKVEEAIKKYSEVERVKYVTSDEALKLFNEEEKDNTIMMEAMEELGENPLGITLNIKAYNPDDYGRIASMIENADFKDKIEKVNYQEHKGIIEGLNQEIKSSQKMAMVLGGTLSAIAILITFNTIRITIYTHRKEIGIMKLVGGSNWYVTAPFIWEGFFYGITAAIVAIATSGAYLYFIVWNSGGDSVLTLSNIAFIKKALEIYLMDNIVWIVGVQFLAGILLGVISSLITVRKYLKV